MTQDKIANLLSPFLDGVCLSAAQLNQIVIYTDLLMKWNSRINLTAVREPEQVITRHFGESLFAAKHLFPVPRAKQSAIDVGSGAGFPGLPLKIWNPAVDLTLVEANHRKAVFLREVVRALDLSGARALAGRAEHMSERTDLVILRAVEHFEQILPVAHKLVAPNGRIALLIGNSQIEASRSLLTDIQWQVPLPLPLSQSRSLLVGYSAA